MTYARVGVYTLQGTPTEVAHIASEEMLPVFKRQPGFLDYQVIATEGKMVSISTWQTEAQANEGGKQAATLVGQHPGKMTLEQSFVGDAMFPTPRASRS